MDILQRLKSDSKIYLAYLVKLLSPVINNPQTQKYRDFHAVFDVNTEYFVRNGGYEYAKSFFEEAYRLVTKEIGGEHFILSAVMQQ